MANCAKKISIFLFLIVAVALVIGLFLPINTNYAYAEEELDFTDLYFVVNEAKGLSEADYSKASWARFELALRDAEGAINLPSQQTQSMIDMYTSELIKAISLLGTDRVGLLNMLFKAENIIEKNYEEQSVIALKEVIRVVLTEINVLNLPQYRIDELTELLDESIGLLVRVIDCPDEFSMYINEFFELDVIPIGGSWEYDEEFFAIDEESGKIKAVKTGMTEVRYVSLQGQTKTVTVTIANPPTYDNLIFVGAIVIVSVILISIIIFLVLKRKQTG